MTGYAQYIGHDGKAISSGGAPDLGLSFDPDPQISALRLVEGKDPTTPHQVVMDLGTAQKYGFKVGQQVRILLQGPTQTFTISGLARFGTADNLAGATLAAFDPPTAQRLLGEVGQFDAINVVAQSGSRQGAGPAGHRPRAAAASKWSPARPWSTRRRAPSARPWASSTGPARVRLHRALRGGFTILNTFSITVGQRTRELALLRIVGASRRQVFRSVLGEAAIVGLVSSLIGLGLGVLAALGLEKLLSGFGVTLPSGPLVFEARTVVVASSWASA